MDIRSKIIDKVLEALSGIDQNVLEKVERTLYIQLQEYEVQERSTEIVVHDNSNLGLVKKFIATKKLEGKSQRTLKKYQPELEKVVAFLNKNLFEVDTYDLRLYLALYKENRKISNRTLDNIRKTISSFFSWLHDEGLIGRNPARALKQIKYEQIVRKPFTAVEREKLKNACSQPRDLALVEFLYASGLRVSEVISLDRNSIDFVTREATVIGKGGKERIVYLDTRAKIHLERYFAVRRDESPALFVRPTPPFIRVSKPGVEYMVRMIGQRAHVTGCHPHRFRRTLATRLLERGMPIEQVQAVLGHTKIDTTLLYARVNQQNVKLNHSRYV